MKKNPFLLVQGLAPHDQSPYQTIGLKKWPHPSIQMIPIHALKCFMYSAETFWRRATPSVSFLNLRFPIKSKKKKNWREIFVRWWIFEPVLLFPRHVQLFWKIHLSPMRKNSFGAMIYTFFFFQKPWPDTSHVYFGSPLLTDTTSRPVSSFGAMRRRRHIASSARTHAR